MIVLLRPDLVWQQLLAQIGFPFRVGLPGSDTRVLIVPARAESDRLAAALGTIVPGCGLLTEKRLSVTTSKDSFRLEALPFRLMSVLKLGRPAIRAFPAPNEPGTMPEPEKAGKPGTTGGQANPTRRPVVERVAAHDRGEVRRQVVAAIQRLLELQSLPGIRLAQTPAGTRSVFGFRVDTDFCGREELALTRNLADSAGMAFTWFINTEAHGPLLGELKTLLSGQDIQVHCHTHDVFRTIHANRENMRKALAILRSHGYRVSGAASPWGDWNPAWDTALGELGLAYSSDFAAGYDDLPFRPVVEGRVSPLLQVPVHPVCLGRLSAAHASKDFIIKYFQGIVSKQIMLREPCWVYDHPTAIAAHHNLMLMVLTDARNACKNTMTLSEFADWWLEREQVVWSASAGPDGVELTVTQGNPKTDVEVEYQGKLARIPLRSGRYPLAGLSWHRVETPAPRRLLPVPLRTRLTEKLRWYRRQKRAGLR